MGNALCRLNDFASAAKVYQQALEIDQTQQPVLYNLGNALYMTENYEEAIDAYKRALAIKETAVCHFNLAVTYDAKNDLQKAFEHFQATITMDAGNIDAYCNLG